ncbi:MAG TPA: heavy-metal-associated domain-containing protein, partial [Isosphaeraceae bacterium]|nr:heavy-metal-associated domain-containing protein [Isosphaeraceae bacterium]
MTQELRIPIAGMRCGHCQQAVSQALEAVPGVEAALVDLPSSSALVTIDPDRANAAMLRQAVEAAGYSVPETNSPQSVPAHGVPSSVPAHGVPSSVPAH